MWVKNVLNKKMLGQKCCGVKTILGGKFFWGGLRIFGNKLLGVNNFVGGIRVLISSVKWENPPYTEDLPKPYRFISVKCENLYYSPSI